MMKISVHTNARETLASGKTLEADYSVRELGAITYAHLSVRTPNGDVDFYLHSRKELEELAFALNAAAREAIDTNMPAE